MKPGKLTSYTDLECALMVMLGCYGNGQARREALGSRYNAVQAIVEVLVNTDRVPDGKGSGFDPEALQDAIDDVFEDTLIELRKEIIEKL